MGTILVQMGEPTWTEEALHLACAMARNMRADLVLINLMPVQHYCWLGTPLGDKPLTPEICEQLGGYQAIAESYGQDLVLKSMQCTTVMEGLVAAVEHLDTKALFAYIAPSSIPLWRKYQIWDLQRELAHRSCALHLLDRPVQTFRQPELGTIKQHV